MSKAKATHYGTCQVCGCRQKLPAGSLSKHGYTIEYGWFSGVCTGAHHLPYEQDCSLIKGAVNATKAAKKRVQDQIKELKTTTEYVWVHVYYGYRIHTNGKGGYVWEKHGKADIQTDERGRKYVMGHLYPEGTVPSQLNTCSIGEYQYTGTLKDKIIYQNSLKIKDLERQIDQMNVYIKWQEERIKNWKLAELEPVKA